MKKYIAEFIGTFTLVLFGTGIAVITGNFLAIALAFGLAIVTSAYVIGDISGCHVNPAVSLAMLIRGDISLIEFIGYVISQVLGAIAGTGILYLILAFQIQIRFLKPLLSCSSLVFVVLYKYNNNINYYTYYFHFF